MELRLWARAWRDAPEGRPACEGRTDTQPPGAPGHVCLDGVIEVITSEDWSAASRFSTEQLPVPTGNFDQT